MERSLKPGVSNTAWTDGQDVMPDFAWKALLDLGRNFT